MTDDLRYGVFLRPDPATCWAITQITGALRAQFGLVSAGAFPPHATLVGNLRTRARLDELLDAVDVALAGVHAFPLHNAGVTRVGDCWLMDVHTDGTDAANPALLDLAARMIDAVQPLSVPHDDLLVGPIARDRFWAHLSLASHDLIVAPALSDEVGAFLDGLPIPYPIDSVAEVVSVFAFESADWRGQWWRTLSWRHVRSWTLPAEGAPDE